MLRIFSPQTEPDPKRCRLVYIHMVPSVPAICVTDDRIALLAILTVTLGTLSLRSAAVQAGST